jgi:diguanylate cyclase (GGDEF)-like protein/PAS domain S-box-containing protein
MAAISLRLLILEDLPDDAELVVHQLRSAGFEPSWRRVDTEADFVAGLGEDLDLVLADYHLPGFDARRALQHLVDRRLDIPFIIVSGAVGEAAAVAAMKAGASDFVKKDDLGRLGAIVERELRLSRERKTARVERDRAEATVRRLAAIVETSNDAIFGIDLDWKITSWNRGAETLYGYSADEAIGQHVQMLVPPELVESRSDYAALLLAGIPVPPFETVRLHKSGRRIDVSVAVSPLRDREGRLIGRSAIVRDISDRKRADHAVRESEDRYRRIVETAFEGIWVIDTKNTTTLVNRQMAEMLGYSVEEMLGRPAIEFMDGPSQAEFQANTDRRKEVGRLPRHEFRFRRKDGSELWTVIDSITMLDATGQYAGSLAMVSDLTERRRAAAELLERTSLYEALVMAQSELGQILILTEGSQPIYINDAFVRLTGFSAEELMGFDSLFDLVPPDHQLPLPSDLEQRMQGQRTRSFETTIVAKDGRRIELEGTDLRFQAGGRTLVFTLAQDVTERKAARRALEHQATHDSLTGLANRRLIRERIDGLVWKSGQAPFTIISLGLDHFREVNDTFGHRAGDLLLQQVALRLKAQLSNGQTMARLTGDTFAALLPGVGSSDAHRDSAKLLQAMEEPFEVEGQALDIGASVGAATFPDGGKDADELLRHADIAMSVAKTSRGTVVRYHGELERGGANRLALMAELRRAIHENRLVLHYQPLVNLRTGQLIRFETLVRWEHPRRGVVPPNEFIPFAEKTRLIRPLTRWVLRSALCQWRTWHDAGRSFPMAVNISMRDLIDPAFPDEIDELIREAGADPRQLVLEITEGVIMTEPERVLQILARLKRPGVRLAVDDFGTGYSSLAYLHRLPVDEIKIDKSFISAMAGDVSKSNIVRAAVDLGHSLRLEVVAEGIEDAQTWDLLTALGCDVAQGYYISRPLSAAAAEQWMDGWNGRVQVAA